MPITVFNRNFEDGQNFSKERAYMQALTKHSWLYLVAYRFLTNPFTNLEHFFNESFSKNPFSKC